MKFLQAIRFDRSDAFVFDPPCTPGEWVVSGAFEFAERADRVSGKDRQAMRNGFLGTETWGRSTLAAVADMTDQDHAEVVDRLARHFVERYGAPDLDAARPAAEAEVGFVADLCRDAQVNALLAVEREPGPDGLAERFRIVRPPAEGRHARIWDVVADDRGEGGAAPTAGEGPR